ncbi:hypothetical protein TcasGA2_TC004228 [Tribolium castaneum]|uniref:Uncharacterized protein n=1 Tax=Tribolium castaneum TaxID=7070 RepID=D7GXS0_TRICA|nr:hypothetical protein TcasGA2_TC004228 [Tribolium castaneum]
MIAESVFEENERQAILLPRKWNEKCDKTFE